MRDADKNINKLYNWEQHLDYHLDIFDKIYSNTQVILISHSFGCLVCLYIFRMRPNLINSIFFYQPNYS